MKKLALISILVLLAASASMGATDPILTRGFNPNQVYSFNQFDSVNTLSGSLGITVPLGQPYKSNGTLQYSFALRYDSNFWDFISHDTSSGSAGQGVVSHQVLRNFAEVQSGDGVVPVPGLEAIPSAIDNAGLGWSISLGEVRERWAVDDFQHETYIDESGAEHPFTEATLHGQPVPSSSGALFTQDGSYLRLTRTSNEVRVVEFPDGIRKTFRCASNCSTPRSSRVWLLEQIADPFGHLLDVTRSPAARPTGGTWTWTFVERVQYPGHAAATEVRRHTLVFEMANGRERLRYANLAATNGRIATYTLTYDDRVISRPDGATYFGASPAMPLNSCRRFDVSWLRSVEFPDADPSDSVTGPAGRWSFEYRDGDPQGTSCPGLIPTNESVPTASFGGKLIRATLPTGGSVVYNWGHRIFRSQRCQTAAPATLRGYRAPAVLNRQMFKANNEADGRPWLYHATAWPFTIEQGAPGNPNCNEYEQYVSSTVDPDGNTTVSYFQLFRRDEAGEWVKDEHSLPFTRLTVEDPAAAQPLYLSSRDFRCTRPADDFALPGADRGSAAGPFFNDQNVCGLPYREKFLRYRNFGNACGAGQQLCQVYNARAESEKIRYYAESADGTALATLDSFATTDHSGFDNFGHFRTTTTSGNFASRNTPNRSVSDLKVETTDFVPSITADRWLLNLHSRKTTTAGAQTVITKFAFDPATGFLTESRQLLGANDAARDLRVTYSAQTDSARPALFRTIEQYFGGDAGGTAPDYVIARTKLHGEIARTEYRDCNGATFLPRETNGVDANTGLVIWSDAAGMDDDSQGPFTARTLYDYDLMGRVTRIQPPGQNALVYEYLPRTSSEQSSVSAFRMPDRTAGAESSYVYDDFGRLRFDRTRQLIAGSNPNSSREAWTEIEHAWLPAGMKASESTRHERGSTTVARTTYSNFDPFGRPRRIVKPDGKITTIQYDGIRTKRTRTHGLALVDGDATADVAEHYDRYGRVVVVSEHSGATTGQQSGNLATIYDYDARGNLVTVDNGENRNRLFRYDNRGLLASETYPELGTGAGRQIAYEYDARGNIRRSLLKNADGTTVRELLFSYDPGERPVGMQEIRRSGGTSYVPIKTFEYYDASAHPLSRFKPSKAVRFNAIQSPAVPVTTTYQYSATNGETSQVSVATPELASTTRYEYDAFGLVRNIIYPAIPGCATCPARTVRYDRSHTVTTSVRMNDATLADLEYHPNGILAFVRHANGTLDSQYVAPNMMPRLSGILASFNGNFWSTGVYQYDGAGNISAIGSDHSFTYDRVGRLRRAAIPGATEQFEYDRFGNMTRRNGTAIAIDAATNRLQPASSFVYDDAGNLTSMPDRRPNRTGSLTLTYDAAGKATRLQGFNLDRKFLYDANDERVGTYDVRANATTRSTWTIRGLDKQVLREVTIGLTPDITWSVDHVYRPEGLLASYEAAAGSPAGGRVTHFHLDHLGTPRRSSGPAGGVNGAWAYLPFGEILGSQTGAPHLRFTGHERDDDGTPDQQADLDYMHARFYSATLARFLSVDPVNGAPEQPQKWNRYAYARNNPLRLIDPDGQSDIDYNKLTKKVGPISGWVYLAVDSPIARIEKTSLLGLATIAGVAGGLFADSVTSVFRLVPPIERGGLDKLGYQPLPLTRTVLDGMGTVYDHIWPNGFLDYKAADAHLNRLEQARINVCGGALVACEMSLDNKTNAKMVEKLHREYERLWNEEQTTLHNRKVPKDH